MPAVVEEEEAWGLEMATDSVRDLGSLLRHLRRPHLRRHFR